MNILYLKSHNFKESWESVSLLLEMEPLIMRALWKFSKIAQLLENGSKFVNENLRALCIYQDI